MALGQDILESILYGTTNVEPIRRIREERRAMEMERMQAEAQAQALANFQRQLAGEAVRGERGSARQEYLAAQETAKQKKREMEVWTGIMDDDRDPSQILSDPETYKKASKAGQGIVDRLLSARDALMNMAGGAGAGGAFQGEMEPELSGLTTRRQPMPGAQTLPAAPAEAFQPTARQVPGPLPPVQEAIPAPGTLGPSPPQLGAQPEPMDIQSAIGDLDPMTRAAILAAGPKGPELLLGMISERQKAQDIQERLGAIGGGGAGAPGGFEVQQYSVNPESGNISIQYGQPKLTRFVPKEGDPSRMIGIDERGRAVAEFPAEPQMVVEEVQEGGKVVKKVVNLKETAKGTTLGEAPVSPEKEKVQAQKDYATTQLQDIRNRIMPEGKINRQLLLLMSDLPGVDPGIPGTEGRYMQSTLGAMLEMAITRITGAAAPEAQMNRIRQAYIPSITDNDETIKNKLDRLDQLLTGSSLPKDIQNIIGTGGGEAAAAKKPKRYNAEKSIQAAKDAIGRGASREQVLKELKAAGIPTEGL